MIAECFISNPENKPFVNHIDGNYLNNTSENLEWLSHIENVRHAIVNGLHKIYGEDSHRAKFSNEQADIIRKIKNKGISTKDLVILLGVDKSSINRIYNGETYNIDNKIKSYKL